MDDGGHIELNQFQFLVEIRFAGEVPVSSNASVNGHRICRTATLLDGTPKSFHTLVGSQISLNRIDVETKLAKFLCGTLDLLTIGSDEQVKAILPKDSGQLIPDPAGRSGYHRKLLSVRHHLLSL